MMAGLMSAPELPPKGKSKSARRSTSVYLSEDMVRRLEEIAEQRGYNRNEVIVTFLEWALKEWEKKETKR